MHIHILGIGGTFMGGIALLARQLGHTVTGSDLKLYPPMSTQLASEGIEVMEGYDPSHLEPAPDLVVVGNVMSRGNPAVEYMLDRGLRYTSGPAFLGEHVLQDRWVLAVAGTHGKTTTSGLLAWILEYAGMAPGFLVGGIPENFGVSARLGDTPFFVVEADEYDTAFFDKRSKFVHYRPRTLVLNNLEYDHADIFPDLDSIKRQFHHLVRMVPGNGLIVAPTGDANVDHVLEMGCWTPVEHFSATAGNDKALWTVKGDSPDGSSFDVCCERDTVANVSWSLIGEHNVHNALAAIAAARHAGVPPAVSVAALPGYHNVKRRLELRGTVGNIRVYDDFAHHPTAIRMTVESLSRRMAGEAGARLIAVLEPRSNTMRMGVHRDSLAASLAQADRVYLFRPEDIDWDLETVASAIDAEAGVFDSVEAIVADVAAHARPGDLVLIMSNGAFGGIHDKLLAALHDRDATGADAGVSG